MVNMLPKHKHTWLNYLDALKERTCDQDQTQLTDFSDFFHANNCANSFFRHCTPFIYLLDYKTSAYINMSENFAGYRSDTFLQGGIAHTLDIYEPDHFRLFDQEIFPDRLQILKGINSCEHKRYIFTYTLKLRCRDGKYENFMQRNCFLSDAQCNPVMSVGIVVNINAFHQGNRVVQTVDKLDSNGCPEKQLFIKTAYYLNEEDKLFSKREKEVLLWMSDGLSSKMIAEKLHISENTVNNHRRSMQDKSAMPNATALVSFAIRKEII